jgi:hypothetical protein
MSFFFKQIEWGDLDWIHLAQDRDKGWALVNMTIKLHLPTDAGI